MADKFPTDIPNPAMPLRESYKTFDLIFTADNGTNEQRRKKGNPRRQIDLSWPALLLDEMKTLRQFFMDHTTVQPFLFTHPVEKEEKLYRFSSDTFISENIGFGPKSAIYKVQCQILEVAA